MADLEMLNVSHFYSVQDTNQTLFTIYTTWTLFICADQGWQVLDWVFKFGNLPGFNHYV